MDAIEYMDIYYNIIHYTGQVFVLITTQIMASCVYIYGIIELEYNQWLEEKASSVVIEHVLVDNISGQ